MAAHGRRRWMNVGGAERSPFAGCDMVADPEALIAWIGEAGPGDCVAYHIGLLAKDRLGKVALSRLAACAAWAAADDKIALIQRRLSEGNCQYLAMRLAAPLREISPPLALPARPERDVTYPKSGAAA